MKNKFTILFILLAFIQGCENIEAPVSESIPADILSPLKAVKPEFQFSEVKTTPIPGIYRTTIINGPTIFISSDGKYFFAGDLLEVQESGLVNVLDKEFEADRREQLAKIPMEEMIIFGPEEPKAHLYAFTDVDCGYCRKLHREIPALTELGIEVRYLAYPRAGIGSKSYNKITSAWCAEDPQAALTDLKTGKEIPENVCADNPVAKQYQLGGVLGVTGTPALITETGRLIPGYMPADVLAADLGL